MRWWIARQMRVCSGVLVMGAVLAGVACVRDQTPHVQEVAFVKGGGVALRDQLGPSSGVISTLQGGERVEVLSRRARWAEVRLAGGRRGWLHSRYLASEKLFGQFQQLANQSAPLPSQGRALIRREANLHLEAGSNSDTLYRLTEGDPVEVLTHRTAERQERASSGDSTENVDLGPGQEESAKVEVRGYEDWFLVRSAGGKTGWLRETFFDMDPPIEVARYSEGLRVRAWFVLFEEHSNGEIHPWYLWATVHPKQGLPFDFDEIRVFVWNPAKSRYETAYRERNLFGVYPIQMHSVETPTGSTPGFELLLEDAAGKRIRKSFIMSGRMVRSSS
jgi:SH3-like domain-containing protein